jgi:FAD:protein FMN transferase
LFLAAAAMAADRYEASEPHMGTVASITLYAESPEQAQRGFTGAFRRITQLNAILSDYNPDSELSRACTVDAPLSPDLFTIVSHAQRLARETDGAFDITAGALSRLWRGARAAKRLPGNHEIASALLRTGYRKLVISEDTRRLRCGGEEMQLDAGGIAKGYAAGEALAVLRASGITKALVAISGDIAAGDPPPGRTGWRVKVQDQVVTLSNGAVSTSGDEFQGLEIHGTRYSHVFDPRTGMALRNSPVVSVIADSGIEADSLATAISVLGAEGATSIERRHGVRVIVAKRALSQR